MHVDRTSAAMKNLAPHLRRLGLSLCNRQEVEFSLFNAQGELAVSATRQGVQNGQSGAPFSHSCASCQRLLPEVLRLCLESRSLQSAQCGCGHTIHAAPMVQSELPLGALVGIERSCPGEECKARHAVQAAASLLARMLFLELESVSLAADLALRYEELTILYEASERLSPSSSTAFVTSYTLSKASEAVECTCAVWVARDSDKVTTMLCNPGSEDDGALCRTAERIGHAVRALIPEVGQPEVWTDLRQHLGTQIDPAPYVQAMVVPVETEQHRFGWIVLLRVTLRRFLSGEVKIIFSLAKHSAISMHNAALYRNLNDLLLNTIKTLVSVIEGKDPYTRGHSERVNVLAMRLANLLRLPEPEQHVLNWTSLLHDIGKLKIPEAILQKNARLTPRELRIIQCHPDYGAELLSPIQQLSDCMPGIRHHHERMDGNGYPSGLKGDQIPLVARIIAVVDTWDAITSDRCYRRRFSLEQAERIMQEASGTQLDARIVGLFMEHRAEVTRGLQARADLHQASGPFFRASPGSLPSVVPIAQ